MTQVVVVDDHELIAESVRYALTDAGIPTSVVAPCPLPELLTLLLAERPTLVLLDLDLGVFGSGVEVIAPLILAGIRVLVVTGTPDPLHVAAALERGAVGYHPKSQGLDLLLTRAQAALTTDEPLDIDERQRLLDELVRSREDKQRAFGPFRLLTDREQATLEALSEGSSVHEIATEWVVSEATVRTHVRGVLTKLGAPSQLAAVARASRAGWLSEPRHSLRTN